MKIQPILNKHSLGAHIVFELDVLGIVGELIKYIKLTKETKENKTTKIKKSSHKVPK